MTKTTNYKNISWDKTRRLWHAHITYKGVNYECGYFHDERTAALSVDKKIIALGLDYRKLQILKPVKNETTNP